MDHSEEKYEPKNQEDKCKYVIFSNNRNICNNEKIIVWLNFSRKHNSWFKCIAICKPLPTLNTERKNQVFNTNPIFLIPRLLDSNNLSFKYKRFNPTGCKDIGIRKAEFFAIPKLKFIISLIYQNMVDIFT